MTLEKPVYKQDWGHQTVSLGDLQERELDPAQLSGIPRLYDLGLRESFSAVCMGKQKKSLCRKRKNDAVSLESEVNCLSFTERWRIWLSVFHFLFPISIPGEWGWILWPWVSHIKEFLLPKDPYCTTGPLSKMYSILYLIITGF